MEFVPGYRAANAPKRKKPETARWSPGTATGRRAKVDTAQCGSRQRMATVTSPPRPAGPQSPSTGSGFEGQVEGSAESIPALPPSDSGPAGPVAPTCASPSSPTPSASKAPTASRRPRLRRLRQHHRPQRHLLQVPQLREFDGVQLIGDSSSESGRVTWPDEGLPHLHLVA